MPGTGASWLLPQEEEGSTASVDRPLPVHDALHGCASQASRWASGRSSYLAVPEDSQALGEMERPAEGLGDKSCQRSEMLSPRWAKEM